MVLAQLGGQALMASPGRPRGSDDFSTKPSRSVPVRALVFARASSSARAVAPRRSSACSLDRLEPGLKGLGQDQSLERQVLDEDDRLVVPELGPDRPVEEGRRGPQVSMTLFFGVEELDRLAPEDLLDLLAGERVDRLDAARVHDGELAESLVGRSDAEPLAGAARPPRAREGGRRAMPDRGPA